MGSTAGANGVRDESQSVVEEYGVRVGAVMNWPPLAGRMMATLMLNDGPMTADQLRDELGASAGGISECSRILVESGVVERIKTVGTRKKSFAYRPDAWVACLQHQIAMSTQLRELATSACATLRRKPRHIRRRFEDMRHYQDFMTKSLTDLEDTFKEAAGFTGPADEAASA